MSFSTFLIRSVGAATIGLSLYEMNYKSKEHAVYGTREDTAKHLTDLYLKHNTSTDGHISTERMKDRYREWAMDDTYGPNLQYAKNRTVGFKHGFMANIIPLALGVGALMAHSTSRLAVYKGFVPKIVSGCCAIAIGLFAANNIYKNVLGLGRSHPPGFYP
ncbi:MAG: hypothetical protein WCF95_05345 [bacterium]